MSSGEIVGVEALARWKHPQYGELGAATLFGVAGTSDYLVQLSEHVHRRAIGAAAAWPESLRHLRLAVNITAADIVRPGFAAQFLTLVRESGFAPERLTVEVTESGLIEDLAGAAALLAELRGGNLRVAIERFRDPAIPSLSLSEGVAARLSQDRQEAERGHCQLDP